MTRWRRAFRAEYVYQPLQLGRRVWRQLFSVRQRAQAGVRLPWGFPITINPTESIGRSIVALSILDLAVTETIWRLVDDGDTCADVGANIGYMTSVMAARLRNGGDILCFEPQPWLADRLRANVAAWKVLTDARITVCECALGDGNGRAVLHIPGTFALNQGEASLLQTAAEGRRTEGDSKTVEVDCRTMDDVLGHGRRVGFCKVDVEGFEANVFRGATGLLRSRLIRDIVFEEHRPPPVESVDYLAGCGYVVYRVARSLRGPLLLPPDARPDGELDAPTYLATCDTARAADRFRARGWHCLQRSR